MSKANDVIFIDESDGEKIGLFCKVCDYILSSQQDIETSRQYSCCNECYMTFAASREEEWQQGWRPDEETLNRYKESRRILISNLNKILEKVYESKF
jgi:hypothetical protein